VAAADEVFDSIEVFRTPLTLWTNDLWQIKYAAFPLWKFFDWTAEGVPRQGAFLSDVLAHMRARRLAERATPLLSRGDIDLVVENLFPSRDGYDLEAAHADFAAALLFLHDVEQVPAGSAEAPDRFPDAVGAMLPETAPGDLWGDWGTGEVTAIDTPLGGPSSTSALPVAAPFTHNTTLGQGRSELLEIDLSAALSPSEAARIKVTATVTGGGSRYADVGVRVYWRPTAPGDRAELIWSADGIATTGADSGGGIPAAWKGRVVVVVTNVGTSSADIAMMFEEVVQQGLVLSAVGGAIGGLDLDGPGTMTVCDDPQLSPTLRDTLRADLVPVAGAIVGYAVSYPLEGQIRFYDRATCAEAGLTDLAVAGIPAPGPMDLTVDGASLIVGGGDPNDPCAPGVIARVDLDTFDVVASVPLAHGANDLTVLQSPSGGQAIATFGGHEGCEDSYGLATIDLSALGTAGPVPSSAVVPVDLPGVWWTHPGRITTPPDRSHAVFTMGEWNGRIGILSPNLDLLVLEPPPTRENWNDIADVAVTTEDDGDLSIFFVTAETEAENALDTCLDGQWCSGLRWISWTPGTTDPADFWWGGDRMLPHRNAHRVEITPDRRTLYIAHEGASRLTIWNLGSGALDASLFNTTTPYVESEQSVTEIWMPR
jgi:hypothetical protein